MSDNELPPLPVPLKMFLVDGVYRPASDPLYTDADMLAYAHAARAPLLAEIERLRAREAELCISLWSPTADGGGDDR